MIDNCQRNSRAMKMCDKHYRRSRKCSDLTRVGDNSLWTGMKGRSLTEETKEKLRQSHIGKKGIPHTERHKKYMSRILRGNHNGMWKGDDVCYSTLHDWVRRNIVMPSSCPRCGLVKRLDACNMSGKYMRVESDWEYLCRKCHFEKYEHRK